MKTVVNREPRGAGAIAEHWNGFDESGSIFLPDLQNFAVAIAASPLPENTVITFGNRDVSFLDRISSRQGSSLFTFKRTSHHHGGLDTPHDVSPQLSMQPLNATWSAANRAWMTTDREIRVRISPTGPTAQSFLSQPAHLSRFVDGRLIGHPSKTLSIVTIPLADTKARQLVSINWASDWGPVAANTIAVKVAQSEVAGR